VANAMTKKEILKALDALPEDATIEDAMERLYLLHKIERGLKQIEEGKDLTQEEVKAQLAKWMEERLVSGAGLNEAL
jgi:predicted transcriptional regulator